MVMELTQMDMSCKYKDKVFRPDIFKSSAMYDYL